jgi:hypothetical protein
MVLTGNYTQAKVTKIAANPPQLGARPSLFDLTAIDNLETTSPDYRVVGGVWTWGDLQVNQGTLYGPSPARQPHRLLAGHQAPPRRPASTTRSRPS